MLKKQTIKCWQRDDSWICDIYMRHFRSSRGKGNYHANVAVNLSPTNSYVRVFWNVLLQIPKLLERE